MLIAYTVQNRKGDGTQLRVKQAALFSKAIKSRLQRIGSPARWIMSESAWSTPLTPGSVVRLAEAAAELGEQVEWRDNLATYAEQHLKQADYEHEVRLQIERVMQDPSAPLDDYVTAMFRADGTPCGPMRHQKLAYHWSLRVRGLLLAHEMGLGKTREAVDAAGGWYRQGQIPMMSGTVLDGKPAVTGGVLVVCPRTVMRTWRDELLMWQNCQSITIHGSSAQKKMRLAGTPSHFHIVNYEGLKYVKHNNYAGLILDEVHKCANHSGFTKNALILAARATKKIGLTGTPISNDLKSIFFPMLTIDGGRALGPSKTAFLEKYFQSTFGAGGFQNHEANEGAHAEIGKAVSTSVYFLKKKDVLDLPPKTHTPIYLPMTDEQRRYYDQVRNEALVYIQDSTVTVEQAAARMMKLLQICQGFALTDGGGRHFTNAKCEALLDLLTDQLREQKVIVWAYFQYEIEQLSNALATRGISHLRIDGTVTSQKIRDEQKDRWNSDSSIKVFIRQLSMSEGVTLLGTADSPCSTMIYHALNYRMTDLLQSQDRIHRIGQKNACTYLYLLTENGVDRKVYQRLLEKVEDADAVQKHGKEWYAQLLREAA